VGYAPDRTGDLNELGSRAAKVLEGGLGVGADVELITCDELLNRSSSVAKLPRVVKA
jgi:phenylacetate-CoA ligase